MTGITGVGMPGMGGAAQLATNLEEIAGDAARAGKLGDYINPPSKLQVRGADKAAGRAIDGLDRLMPQIATHGVDGDVQMAMAAADNLQAGREALRSSVTIEDDVLRSGRMMIDDVRMGAAKVFFDDAATKLRGLADGMRLQSVPLDDLFSAITKLR